MQRHNLGFLVLLMGLVSLGAGCFGWRNGAPKAPQAPQTPTAEQGEVVDLALGGAVGYADGLRVELVRIDDSRCPEDAVCVWQGELSALLSLSGGAFAEPQEARLGTVMAPTAVVRPYALELAGATASTASIIVTLAGQDEPEMVVVRHADLLVVESPSPGEIVGSPLVVRGQARGTWYFEATFPLQLLDSNGNVLVSHYAQAEGDWMTEDYVPFSAELSFATPGTEKGVLVLSKSNASGLPEHDDELRIPVSFDIRDDEGEVPTGDCRTTGCGGQVCADRDVVTTCEYRPEYACYESAVCERQPDGECGWTPTTELLDCVAEARR